MTNNSLPPNIERLLMQQTYAIKALESRVRLLERENARRKQELEMLKAKIK